MVVLVVGWASEAQGYIHDISIDNDDRNHFFITNFGFLQGGYFSIEIFEFKVNGEDLKEVDSPDSDFGFYVKISSTDQSQILDESHQCTLKLPTKSKELKWNITSKDTWEVETEEDGLYNFFFVNCANTPISFKIKVTEFNVIGGKQVYLPIGIDNLPTIYAVFTVLFLIATLVWIIGAMRGKETLVNRVHYIMTLLLFFKILALFSRAIEFHFLKATGNAEGWNIPYYVFAFCKGIVLFSAVALIGMGYTFFKYYLSDRDSKILLVVLPLQVLANVANIISTEGSWGSVSWRTWTTIFQIVDIACCVAVVVPIALSIKHLKEAAATDGKAAKNVEKLTLFRQFYLIVLAYIYFTRIVVVFTKLAVPFHVEWINYVLEEGASLAFYIIIGYKFRPKKDSPYFETGTGENDENEIELNELT
uniref:Intimal thickness related receptor IRP domain-containing protein n=1 Tax=Arcella intermedia TaxID=1963864 RepID=A0A6B2L5D2_9EUKA